ncbi:hypothetical protein AYO38_05020 [bacterium SCGC AG-212-C10]|nr:hypothetical protein AYO38_05020 [bacterium SCGC AG-212-C10]
MTALTPGDELPPTLPHYLRPGLRIVFVGYNPAIYSAAAGHYYARPGNVFWRQLNASGLLTRVCGPEDDAMLMDEAGIGFTDLCPRPTVRAEELTTAEIAEGAARLYRELIESAPRYAVFSGKGIYQHFARHALGVPAAALAGRPYGAQPERLSRDGTPPAASGTVPYVVPSSSGLASKWHAERQTFLAVLAELLRDGAGSTQR